MTGVPDWRASAARFLFETAPAPAPSLPTSCAMELNDSQERALASASNAPLTVITGPPGTGKSQTVAAIVADAWLRGESALVTSTNNTPIDGVITDKMLPLDPGLILRTGNSDKRRELGARLRELLEHPFERPSNEPLADLPEATLARHQLTSTLEKRARREQAVLVTAERRQQAREPLWGSQQPPPIDRPPLRRSAERACRTRWRWLKRRRTQAYLMRLGIQDLSVTAEHVRDWVRAEDAFEAAWQDLMTFSRRTQLIPPSNASRKPNADGARSLEPPCKNTSATASLPPWSSTTAASGRAAARRARSSTSPASTRTSAPSSPGFAAVTTWTPTGWRCGAPPWVGRTSSRSRPTTPGSLPWWPRSLQRLPRRVAA